MRKIKDMRKSGWRRCVQKEYFARECVADGVTGVESLSVWTQLKDPLCVREGKTIVTIADDGYQWLQIALQNKNVWLTAMYNAQDELAEVYFDVTSGNHLCNTQDPWFEDLYLDVVLFADGRWEVLDADELEAAGKRGEISRAEYRQAKKTCKALCNYLADHWADVVAYCAKELQACKAQIQQAKQPESV